MSKETNLLRSVVGIMVAASEYVTTYAGYLKKADNFATILHKGAQPTIFNGHDTKRKYYSTLRGQFLSHSAYFIKHVGHVALSVINSDKPKLYHLAEFCLNTIYKIGVKIAYLRRNVEWKEEKLWLDKYSKYSSQITALRNNNKKLDKVLSSVSKDSINNLIAPSQPLPRQTQNYTMSDAKTKIISILIPTFLFNIYNSGYKISQHLFSSESTASDVPDIYTKPLFTFFNLTMVIFAAAFKIEKGEKPTKDALIQSRHSANTDLEGEALHERVMNLKITAKALKIISETQDSTKSYSNVAPQATPRNHPEYFQKCKNNLLAHYSGSEKYLNNIAKEKSNLTWTGKIKNLCKDAKIVVKNSCGWYGYYEPSPVKPNYAKAIVVAEKRHRLQHLSR